MTDDMFFTKDERSLQRGKRIQKRTETCRPCLVRTKSGKPIEVEGVVMDVTPYGMSIRMIDSLPIGTEVTVQLMRDDTFELPFSHPRDGRIVRCEGKASGFTDHGVKLALPEIEKGETRPIAIDRRPPISTRKLPARMHTIDFTVGGPPKGRPSR